MVGVCDISEGHKQVGGRRDGGHRKVSLRRDNAPGRAAWFSSRKTESYNMYYVN